MRRWAELRVGAYAIGVAALFLLLLSALISTSTAWAPGWNPRCIGLAVGIASCAFAAITLRRHRARLTPSEASAATVCGLLAIGLALWLTTQETAAASYYYRGSLGGHYDRWGELGVSMVWSFFGALLLLSGIRAASHPIRLIALGLLFATVCKVFLFDLGFLDGAFRILALGGLGVSLLSISWLYGRYGNGMTISAGARID